MPLLTAASIGTIFGIIDGVAAALEKRELEGEDARKEAADMSEADAAHEDLQAAMDAVIAGGKAPAAATANVDAVRENAPRIAALLREAAALARGEA